MGDLLLDILLLLIYTVIYFGTIVFVIGFPPVFLWTSIYAKKRRRIQDGIVKENAGQVKAGRWFRVNYSPEARLRRPTRKELWQSSWAWDATGILFVTEAAVTFLGQSVYSPSRYVLTFDPRSARVAWAGVVKPSPLTPVKWLLTIGGTLQHWLEIECEGNKHCFTSETGPLVRASMRRTREIYDKLCEVLPSGGSTPS